MLPQSLHTKRSSGSPRLFAAAVWRQKSQTWSHSGISLSGLYNIYFIRKITFRIFLINQVFIYCHTSLIVNGGIFTSYTGLQWFTDVSLNWFISSHKLNINIETIKKYIITLWNNKICHISKFVKPLTHIRYSSTAFFATPRC